MEFIRFVERRCTSFQTVSKAAYCIMSEWLFNKILHINYVWDLIEVKSVSLCRSVDYV